MKYRQRNLERVELQEVIWVHPEKYAREISALNK